jgi:hypothetical protein
VQYGLRFVRAELDQLAESSRQNENRKSDRHEHFFVIHQTHHWQHQDRPPERLPHLGHERSKLLLFRQFALFDQPDNNLLQHERHKLFLNHKLEDVTRLYQLGPRFNSFLRREQLLGDRGSQVGVFLFRLFALLRLFLLAPWVGLGLTLVTCVPHTQQLADHAQRRDLKQFRV